MLQTKNWVNRNLISIVTAILFIATILLFLFGKVRTELFFGIIGSIATIYLGVIKYKIENDNTFMNLFIHFNQRYNDKLNDIFNKYRYIEKEKIKKDITKVKNTESESLNVDEEKLIIDYFNLCAEEYLWRSKNRIPKNVWKAWKAGIEYNLEIEQVKVLFKTEMNKYKISYYGLDKEFKEFLN